MLQKHSSEPKGVPFQIHHVNWSGALPRNVSRDQKMSWEEVGSFSKLQQQRKQLQENQHYNSNNDEDNEIENQVNRLLLEDNDDGISEECIFELDDDIQDVTRRLSSNKKSLLKIVEDYEPSDTIDYDSLSSPIDHSKKNVCKFYPNCKSGSSCKFAHVQQQQPSSPMSFIKVVAAAAAPMASPPNNTIINNHKQQIGKIEYCKFYQQGYCRNGDECPFAHQILPPLEISASSPQQTTLEVCPFFLKGECKYGDKCRFTHEKRKHSNGGSLQGRHLLNEESLQKFAQIPCKYYVQQGQCPFGDACYYKHHDP